MNAEFPPLSTNNCHHIGDPLGILMPLAFLAARIKEFNSFFKICLFVLFTLLQMFHLFSIV